MTETDTERERESGWESDREREGGSGRGETVLNHFLLILILSFEYFIPSQHGESAAKVRAPVLCRRIEADE